MQTDYESKRQNGFEDAQQSVRRSETIAAAQLENEISIIEQEIANKLQAKQKKNIIKSKEAITKL